MTHAIEILHDIKALDSAVEILDSLKDSLTTQITQPMEQILINAAQVMQSTRFIIEAYYRSKI